MGTRDQILEAAIGLFARQGYTSTTVAQIEEAAGLSPGSGGLYRHFPSKKALVEATIDWAEQHINGPGALDDRLFRIDEPEVALRAIAEVTLRAFRSSSDFYLMLFRFGDDTPIDRGEVVRRLSTVGHVRLAGWLEMVARTGTFRTLDDYAAAAALMLASLGWFHYAQPLTGDTLGGVSEDVFVDEWVLAQLRYLQP